MTSPAAADGSSAKLNANEKLPCPLLWKTRFSSWKSTVQPSGTKMSTPVASIVVPLPPCAGVAAVARRRLARWRRSASSLGEDESPPSPGEMLPTEARALGRVRAREPRGERRAAPLRARRGVARCAPGSTDRADGAVGCRRRAGRRCPSAPGRGRTRRPAMPPRAPTATVAAVIMAITLSRLLLKYSSVLFTGGVGGGRSLRRAHPHPLRSTGRGAAGAAAAAVAAAHPHRRARLPRAGADRGAADDAERRVGEQQVLALGAVGLDERRALVVRAVTLGGGLDRGLEQRHLEHHPDLDDQRGQDQRSPRPGRARCRTAGRPSAGPRASRRCWRPPPGRSSRSTPA